MKEMVNTATMDKERAGILLPLKINSRLRTKDIKVIRNLTQ
jgi:hypothetical protein